MFNILKDYFSGKNVESYGFDEIFSCLEDEAVSDAYLWGTLNSLHVSSDVLYRTALECCDEVIEEMAKEFVEDRDMDVFMVANTIIKLAEGKYFAHDHYDSFDSIDKDKFKVEFDIKTIIERIKEKLIDTNIELLCEDYDKSNEYFGVYNKKDGKICERYDVSLKDVIDAIRKFMLFEQNRLKRLLNKAREEGNVVRIQKYEKQLALFEQKFNDSLLDEYIFKKSGEMVNDEFISEYFDNYDSMWLDKSEERIFGYGKCDLENEIFSLYGKEVDFSLENIFKFLEVDGYLPSERISYKDKNKYIAFILGIAKKQDGTSYTKEEFEKKWHDLLCVEEEKNADDFSLDIMDDEEIFIPSFDDEYDFRERDFDFAPVYRKRY